jgi:succinate-acetate transporter protein
MERTQAPLEMSGKEGETTRHFHPHDSNNSGTTDVSSGMARHGRFNGEYPPTIHVHHRKIASPAPFGMAAFALTSFVLGLVNVRTRGIRQPTIILSLAYAYGGLLQFLSGMWEMVHGNTVAATGMASYGAFWFSLAIIMTPAFEVGTTLGVTSEAYTNSFGLYNLAWFIFTTLLLLALVRTNFALFFVIFLLDMVYLFAGVAYLHPTATGGPHEGLIKTCGWFGIFTGVMAWYNMLAAMLDRTNSFFTLPVGPFPWAPKNTDQYIHSAPHGKSDREMA